MSLSHLQRSELTAAHDGTLRFVQDTEHGDDVLILRLGDELSERANDVQGPLSVGVSHRPVQEASSAQTTGVIPTVLTTWDSVEVQIDAKTVLSSPLDAFEEISDERLVRATREGALCIDSLPRNTLKVWLITSLLNCPIADGHSDVVETSARNVSEIFFSLPACQHATIEIIGSEKKN